ncbi:MAG TPA: hypothetical protein VJ326_07470 [Thermoplasmata archaeon]|jgi:hypothetical protein|nr:hypothetical protein [Thermoplasmata archaeon]
MSGKAAAIAGGILLVIAGILLVVVVLGLWPELLLVLGMLVVLGIVAVLIGSALVLLVALPYYWATKPSTTTPASGATLERLREP